MLLLQLVTLFFRRKYEKNKSAKAKQQHIDKDVFKNIFHEHWSDFKGTYPMYNTYYYDEVVEKMFNCGNPAKI